MHSVSVEEHYNQLILEENDPVRDPEPLRTYMDQWDGETFLRALRLNGTQSVLEIGVGTGRLALRVLPLCRRLTGLDVSPATVERAKENLRVFPEVELLCADFRTVNLTEKYDRVYSSLTFFHFSDKTAALQKAISLLKPGGWLVVSVSKDQSTELVFPDRKLPLYPDDPESLRMQMLAEGLSEPVKEEVAFAWILSAQKPGENENK